MPVITSAKLFDRFSTDKAKGYNGFASSSSVASAYEENGFLVGTTAAYPTIADAGTFTIGSLTGGGIPDTATVASGDNIVVIERLSTSAKYGERINYSASLIALGSATITEPTAGSTSLGSTILFCVEDLEEYSSNFSLSFTGPACEGEIKANSVSGTTTLYGASSTTTKADMVTAGNSVVVAGSLGTYSDGALTGGQYSLSEDGFDYSTDEGKRPYLVAELMSLAAVPWDTWAGTAD